MNGIEGSQPTYKAPDGRGSGVARERFGRRYGRATFDFGDVNADADGVSDPQVSDVEQHGVRKLPINVAAVNPEFLPAHADEDDAEADYWAIQTEAYAQPPKNEEETTAYLHDANESFESEDEVSAPDEGAVDTGSVVDESAPSVPHYTEAEGAALYEYHKKENETHPAAQHSSQYGETTYFPGTPLHTSEGDLMRAAADAWEQGQEPAVRPKRQAVDDEYTIMNAGADAWEAEASAPTVAESSESPRELSSMTYEELVAHPEAGPVLEAIALRRLMQLPQHKDFVRTNGITGTLDERGYLVANEKFPFSKPSMCFSGPEMNAIRDQVLHELDPGQHEAQAADRIARRLSVSSVETSHVSDVAEEVPLAEAPETVGSFQIEATPLGIVVDEYSLDSITEIEHKAREMRIALSGQGLTGEDKAQFFAAEEALELTLTQAREVLTAETSQDTNEMKQIIGRLNVAIQQFAAEYEMLVRAINERGSESEVSVEEENNVEAASVPEAVESFDTSEIHASLRAIDTQLKEHMRGVGGHQVARGWKGYQQLRKLIDKTNDLIRAHEGQGVQNNEEIIKRNFEAVKVMFTAITGEPPIEPARPPEAPAEAVTTEDTEGAEDSEEPPESNEIFGEVSTENSWEESDAELRTEYLNAVSSLEAFVAKNNDPAQVEKKRTFTQKAIEFRQMLGVRTAEATTAGAVMYSEEQKKYFDEKFEELRQLWKDISEGNGGAKPEKIEQPIEQPEAQTAETAAKAKKVAGWEQALDDKEAVMGLTHEQIVTQALAPEGTDKEVTDKDIRDVADAMLFSEITSPENVALKSQWEGGIFARSPRQTQWVDFKPEKFGHVSAWIGELKQRGGPFVPNESDPNFDRRQSMDAYIHSLYQAIARNMAAESRRSN